MELEEFKKCIRSGRKPKYDRLEYAEKLIEWALKPDSRNLNGFCAENLIPYEYINRWARENEQFRLTYNTVMQIIGQRREEDLKSGKLHVKAYDLNAKVYDHVKRDADRNELEFELRLKKELEKEDKSKVDGRLLELLSELKA